MTNIEQESLGYTEKQWTLSGVKTYTYGLNSVVLTEMPYINCMYIKIQVRNVTHITAHMDVLKILIYSYGLVHEMLVHPNPEQKLNLL